MGNIDALLAKYSPQQLSVTSAGSDSQPLNQTSLSTPQPPLSIDSLLAKYSPSSTQGKGFAGYATDVANSFKGGVQNIKDAFTDITPYNINAPKNQQFQGDIAQADLSSPSDYLKMAKSGLGALNENFSQSNAGKLLAGIGGTLGAPIAPVIEHGLIPAAKDAGVNPEVTQLALNVLPLVARSGAEVPTEAPIEVTKPYENATRTALQQEGATPNSILDAADQVRAGRYSLTQTPIEVPLTLPEALGNNKLLGQQRVLGEQANDAGTAFQDFNKQRLNETLPAVKENLISEANSGGVVPTLEDAGNRIKTLSQGMIDAAIKQRTESVRPLYDQIKNDQVHPDDLSALRTNPLIENEYQKVLGNDSLMERQNVFKPQLPDEFKQYAGMSPELQQQIMQKLNIQPKIVKSTEGGLAPDSIGALDNVKKNISSQLQTYLEKDPGNAMVPKLQAARNRIDSTLKDTSDIYKNANSDYAAQSPEITAMKSGAIGKIARSQTGENAANTYLNLSDQELGKLVPRLKAIDPDAVTDIAGAFLQKATKSTSDQGQLQAYINALSKNDVVRGKMQAIMEPDAYAGQQALVDTLEKIQKGQPGGSNTAPKLQTNADLNSDSGSPNVNITKLPTTLSGVLNRAGGIVLDKGQDAINALTDKIQAKYKADTMKLFLDPDLAQLGQALKNITDEPTRTATVLQWLADKVTPATALAGESEQQRALPAPQKALPAPMKMLPSPQTTVKTEPLSYNTEIRTSTPDISSFAKAESTNNPNAKNPESSASGLYQFTNKTWADMVSRYGAQTGINLRDKADPQAQATMARLLAQDNIKSLQNTLGRMPTKGELYAAHVLGASGAAKLINADPNREAITLFPRNVFDGNHNIFFDGKTSKKPRTASQVYDLLVSKVS